MFGNLFSKKRTQNNSDESFVKGKNDVSMNEYNTSVSGMMKELDDLIADIDEEK